MNTMQMNQEKVVMLENNLALQAEILGRYEQLVAGRWCLFGSAIPQSAKHRC